MATDPKLFVRCARGIRAVRGVSRFRLASMATVVLACVAGLATGPTVGQPAALGAYFGRSGSLVSAEVDRLFRSKWITDFGGSGSLSAEVDHPVSGILSAHR